MFSSKAIAAIWILTIVITFQINVINSILNCFIHFLNKTVFFHTFNIFNIAVLFKHFVLLLTYFRSLVLIVESVAFLKFVNFIKFLIFNVKMSFDVSFVIRNEKVHWFRLRVSHDWWVFSIDRCNFTLGARNILLVSVSMIFISCGILNTFRSSSLSNKILKSITYPNQKEVAATHSAEPIDRRGQISGTIVPMHRKKSTNCYSPSNCFKRIIVLKNILSFQCAIFQICFIFIIFEQINVRSFIFTYITSSKFMNLRHFCSICFCSWIEIIDVVSYVFRVSNGHCR